MANPTGFMAGRRTIRIPATSPQPVPHLLVFGYRGAAGLGLRRSLRLLLFRQLSPAGRVADSVRGIPALAAVVD